MRSRPTVTTTKTTSIPSATPVLGAASKKPDPIPPHLRGANICTSFVDPPLLIPGHDFLGRPLDDEIITEQVTKPLGEKVVQEITKGYIAHMKVQKKAGGPSWVYTLPTSLQPKAGTTFYEMFVDAKAMEVMLVPGLFQRLLYGVPESVLDAGKVAKVIEEEALKDSMMGMVKTEKEVAVKEKEQEQDKEKTKADKQGSESMEQAKAKAKAEILQCHLDV